ncbi:MAG: hypothetical protein V1772_08170, partial [Chloroflexota bacterium]
MRSHRLRSGLTAILALVFILAAALGGRAQSPVPPPATATAAVTATVTATAVVTSTVTALAVTAPAAAAATAVPAAAAAAALSPTLTLDGPVVAEPPSAVALTVYNQNLALVQEERRVALRAGDNQVRSAGVAAGLLPASVRVASLTDPKTT